MPAVDFICPDNVRIPICDCLKEGGCRMRSRCATRSYLQLVSKERQWSGRPSTTQLIAGTMYAFLKIVKDYAISPDDRAFMIHGTKSHAILEGAEDELSFLEEKFTGADEEITGITDVIEIENGKIILTDYKTSGSYKVAKALGFCTIEELVPDTFFKSGPRKGEQKTRKILIRDVAKEDRREWELQLNMYRMKVEKALGKPVDELRIQVIVRDGGTFIAHSRGVFRKVYYFQINRIPDAEVIEYFEEKRQALLGALDAYKKTGELYRYPCNEMENWDHVKCARFCEVADLCPLGKLSKEERKKETDMPIKGTTDVRRLPRLGKIRLGIKKLTAQNKEYPSEVDYFILDPETPSELENKKLIQDFKRLYGDEPKQIKIMIPLEDLEKVFPAYYKRYGSGSALQCKGDGETAVCSDEKYTERLEVIGKNDMGLPKVTCKGEECVYFKEKKCARRATLNVILPEIEGAGVWQIPTGSWNSIVNVLSCLDYVRAVAGRCHMVPLTLERREQEITHDGRKQSHYILHINMQFALAELQKFAQISPEKITLELPEPADEPETEDILTRKNRVIDTEATQAAPPAKPIVQVDPKPAQPEAPTVPPAIQVFRNQFAKAVKDLGEADCYKVLGDNGVEKPEQVLETNLASKILGRLRAIWLEKNPPKQKGAASGTEQTR